MRPHRLVGIPLVLALGSVTLALASPADPFSGALPKASMFLLLARLARITG